MKHGLQSRLSAKAFLAGLMMLVLPGVSTAATETFRAGIDLGNNPATGCNFSIGSVAPGTLPGFELQVTVLVESATTPPSVVSAVIETCNGGSFGNPTALSGYSLDLGGGYLGADSVVGSIPPGFLGGATSVRLAFYSLSSAGSEDALFTDNGLPGGAPITFVLQRAAPIVSEAGLLLLVLVLLGAAIRTERGRNAVATLLFSLIAGTSVVAIAVVATPLAIDPQSDSTLCDKRGELVAVSAGTVGLPLDLRIDTAQLETTGLTILSIGSSGYVTVDLATGELSAAATNGDSALAKFAIDSVDSSEVLRATVSDKFFEIRSSDDAVLASAPSVTDATRWVILVVASEGLDELHADQEAVSATEVVILEDGSVNDPLNVLQYDPGSGLLHVVEFSLANLGVALSDPNSKFIVTATQ